MRLLRCWISASQEKSARKPSASASGRSLGESHRLSGRPLPFPFGPSVAVILASQGIESYRLDHCPWNPRDLYCLLPQLWARAHIFQDDGDDIRQGGIRRENPCLRRIPFPPALLV